MLRYKLVLGFFLSKKAMEIRQFYADFLVQSVCDHAIYICYYFSKLIDINIISFYIHCVLFFGAVIYTKIVFTLVFIVLLLYLKGTPRPYF